MKFWERQQQRAVKNSIKIAELLSKQLKSDFHIAHPNITKIEIKKKYEDEMTKRVNRIERKQARHRKK